MDSPAFREMGVPNFSLVQKSEHGAINGILGVTPLPQFHFYGGGDCIDTVCSQVKKRSTCSVRTLGQVAS